MLVRARSEAPGARGRRHRRWIQTVGTIALLSVALDPTASCGPAGGRWLGTSTAGAQDRRFGPLGDADHDARVLELAAVRPELRIVDLPGARTPRIAPDIRQRIAIDGEVRRTQRALSPPPWRRHPVIGALTGKRIVVSAGHGWFYDPDQVMWTTQRGVTEGLIEDFNNQDFVIPHLLPMLENLGAEVIAVRERSYTVAEVIVDDADAEYTETGEWRLEDGGHAGGSRVTDTATIADAEAIFSFAMPRSDMHPIYIRYTAAGDRATDAHFRVEHGSGATDLFVNQRIDGDRWVYLGAFGSVAGAPVRVSLLNDSAEAGTVSADAVRVGGGMGIAMRGGRTSESPRWQEAARYFTEFMGAPPEVTMARATERDSDIICRPLFADWVGADAYLSVHTNAFDGVVRGTESYIYSGDASEGSAELQAAVHGELLHAITTLHDADWVDRGPRRADLGEVREVTTMPAVLVEVAFHDVAYEAGLLRDPVFRHDTSRGMAIGVMRYFTPGAVPAPRAPSEATMVGVGPGTIHVSWQPQADTAWPEATAQRFRVYLSRDGYGFDDGDATTVEHELDIDGLNPGELVYARVTAENDSGESFPTELLAARVPAGWETPVLFVNGFDRYDEEVDERIASGRYAIEHAQAVADSARGYRLDSASNEAVTAGSIDLADYPVVVWALGLEDGTSEALSSDEREQLARFQDGGGAIFITGAELLRQSADPGQETLATFVRDRFHASFVADDAEAYGLTVVDRNGVLDDLGPIAFDDGSGPTYDVARADVLWAEPGGIELLRHASGGTAAVFFETPAPGVIMGVPFEALLDAEQRAALMRAVLFAASPPPSPPAIDGSVVPPSPRVKASGCGCSVPGL